MVSGLMNIGSQIRGATYPKPPCGSRGLSLCVKLLPSDSSTTVNEQESRDCSINVLSLAFPHTSLKDYAIKYRIGKSSVNFRLAKYVFV